MTNRSSILHKVIKQQICEGEKVLLNATGSSMRPFLSGRGNEQFIVSKHKPEELKLGIIILFLYNDRFVIHRIVNKINETFFVQGDGNCVESEKVEQENILGIVRYVIRNEGEKESPYSLTSRIYWCLWYLLRPIRKYLLLICNLLEK